MSVGHRPVVDDRQVRRCRYFLVEVEAVVEDALVPDAPDCGMCNLKAEF
jgi:hypothetical protein